MNAYNMIQALARALEANRADGVDPDPLLVIQVTERGHTNVVLEGTLSYTLQPAAEVALGTTVSCYSQATLDVNTVSIADGDYLDFRRGIDSSGDPIWKVGAAD